MGRSRRECTVKVVCNKWNTNEKLCAQFITKMKNFTAGLRLHSPIQSSDYDLHTSLVLFTFSSRLCNLMFS